MKSSRKVVHSRGIDHVVLPVHDLDRAAATYEALGFKLTPRAQHPFGTANRLVQLDGCFLELVEVDRPELIGPSATPPGFAEFNRDFLAEAEGLSMLVLEDGRADDVERTRAGFAAAGLQPRPIFTFERDAKQPDGSTAQVGFSLVFVDLHGAPRAGFFTCAQWRPDLFWKPEYQVHLNGARTIHVVTLEAGDPAPVADFLGRFAGVEPRRRAGGFVVDTSRGRLEVREGAGAPRFTRYVIETANVDAVRTHAHEAGIPFRERSRGLEFAADVMYGVEVGFVAG